MSKDLSKEVAKELAKKAATLHYLKSTEKPKNK